MRVLYFPFMLQELGPAIAMLGVELPKLQLPNWSYGKLPGKCQTGALG